MRCAPPDDRAVCLSRRARARNALKLVWHRTARNFAKRFLPSTMRARCAGMPSRRAPEHESYIVITGSCEPTNIPYRPPRPPPRVLPKVSPMVTAARQQSRPFASQGGFSGAPKRGSSAGRSRSTAASGITPQRAGLWRPMASSMSLPQLPQHESSMSKLSNSTFASEYSRSFAVPVRPAAAPAAPPSPQRPTWRLTPPLCTQRVEEHADSQRVGMSTESWARVDGCIYKSCPMVCRGDYFMAVT